jgi:23S rRNA pseudouridine2605 synthase
MVTPNENLHDGKSGGERVAKVIARSGLCSRREAEALIEDRRVSVNGAVIDSAALDILPTDKVLVNGKPLAAREPPRLWRYHKPKGRVTTHKDPEGRPTVFEALPENLPRLISVGRLDFNTEGLLLLTNDGDLARHLELPSTGWTRRYRVRAYGQVSEEQLKELADGVTIDRMNYGPVDASLEREQGDNVWITVSIREGKNREVRRIMEHLGLTVNRLIRVSFGPFMLGELETGQIEEVKTAVLKDQLGPRLTRQLGVRREPLREERRLAPARNKPSYLRRKPENAARPAWPGHADGGERLLKRRRIFDEGSAEAPTVEFVAEKPRFQKGGKGTGERPERLPFRSRAAGEGGREPRFQRRGEGAGERTERAPFRSRGGDEGAREPRFERRGDGTGQRAARPPFRSSGSEHEGGDKPRFQRREESAGERTQRPAFRSRGTGEGPRERRFQRRDEGTGERTERPPFRGRGTGEGPGEPRFQKRSDGTGERPDRPAFRSREGGHEGGHKPRFERRGEGAGERADKLPFRSRGGDEGARKPHFEKRGEGVGERAGRPPFRSRGSEHEGGDNPRFQRRGEGGAGRAERTPFRGREEGGREERAPRFQGSPRGKSGAGHGAEGDRRRSPGARPEGSGWKPRTDAQDYVDTEGGGAPRFNKSVIGAKSGERRPPRRFEIAGDGAPRTRGHREEPAGGERRPHSGKPAWKPFKSREGAERPAGRGTGDRPQRQGGNGKPFRSREGGEHAAGRSTGDGPQRQRGNGKPFRSREGGEGGAGRSAAGGPRRPGGKGPGGKGAPFRSAVKGQHKGHGSGPDKGHGGPRKPRTGPARDKETP